VKTTKIIAILGILGFVLIISNVVGSANVPVNNVLRIIMHRLFGFGDISGVSAAHVAIIWELRLPRVLLAFIVGAALSVSGAIMQSILRNPLASSYTLGVSSGASFGAALVMFTGLPLLFNATMAASGFVFGMATILLVIAIASKMDGRMENITIILVGMVLALFINAITTLLMSLNREQAQSLIFWQMGSFSLQQRWDAVILLAPITLAGVLIALWYSRELDMMTFGEEQSQLMGVNLRQTKWILLITAAAITGSSLAFVGIIGFVDLVAPHVIRRIFGSKHRLIIPLSAIFGGVFMMLCDLVARTIIAPSELPVGVVSALIGAPFFGYVYFSRGRKIRAGS